MPYLLFAPLRNTPLLIGALALRAQSQMMRIYHFPFRSRVAVAHAVNRLVARNAERAIRFTGK